MLTGVALVGALPRRERRFHVGRSRAPRHPDARGTAVDAVLGRRARQPGATTASRTTSPSTSPTTTARSRSSRARPGCSTRGTRTYFKSRLGWSSALIEPELENVPAPDHRWTLGVRRGPDDRGSPHPARRGDPERRNRRPEALSRRRHQPAPAPRGARRTRAGAAVARVPRPHRRRRSRVARSHRGEHAARPFRSTSVPSGYEAPSTPSGYVLVGRSRHPNGVELLYSDGLFTVSVLEQRGEVDWNGLPKRRRPRPRWAATVRRRYVGARRRRARVGARRHRVHVRVRRATRRDRRRWSPGSRRAGARSSKVADYVLGPFGWN